MPSNPEHVKLKKIYPNYCMEDIRTIVEIKNRRKEFERDQEYLINDEVTGEVL
jgi:hypothetical protein